MFRKWVLIDMMESNPNGLCPIPNGILVIVGGHENKGEKQEKKVQVAHRSKEVLSAFVQLTGKKDAVIEVITTAGAQGAESFKDYHKAFGSIGVKHVGHIHHDKRADVRSNELMERINNADAVYFAGGDQLKLTSIYGGTDLLLRLKERYIGDKLVLGGTSAGAMAFSTPMIFAGNKDVQQIAGEVKVTTGLDDKDILDIYQHIFNEAGYEVYTSLTGKDLQELISEFHPALVLLDINLGELNGVDLCRQLKDDPTTAGISVLLVSANLHISELVTLSGADGYIPKPFDLEDLLLRTAGFFAA
jgi:cyanophycinase